MPAALSPSSHLKRRRWHESHTGIEGEGDHVSVLIRKPGESGPFVVCRALLKCLKVGGPPPAEPLSGLDPNSGGMSFMGDYNLHPSVPWHVCRSMKKSEIDLVDIVNDTGWVDTWIW
eukprot:scaffold343550_cov18-Prasinocladus_malaysianus.AAC.1